MSTLPPVPTNSTTFGNSTSWEGSSNSTSSGNSTSWGTSSDDTSSSLGPIDWVPIFASHVGAKRLAISFLTWVAYDFAITIDDSINLFWKYRWGFSKAMYLISRYDSLFTVGAIAAQIYVENPSLSLCVAAPWIVLVGTTVLIIIINLAMITRVYALWDQDIRILMFSLFGFSLNIGSYVILLSYSYAKGFTFVNIPPFTGCTTWPGSDKLWITFITSIGFETMIVCLTVYKAWSVVVQRGITTPLYNLLLADGVVYFIIIILSQVLTIVALYISSTITGPIAGSLPSIAVSGIACNRLFTRLQRLLLDKSTGQSSFPTEDFATPSSPRTSYGGGITKQRTRSPRSKQQSPQDTPQRRRSSLGTRISNHLRSGGGVGSDDIVMEQVSRTSTRNHDSGIRGRLERSSWCGHTQSHDDRQMSGSLDQEIDLSGHYQAIEAARKSHDISEHHKPPREGEVEVEVKQSVVVETWGDPRADDDLLSSHENDGPFTYGSSKTVLDPSPRSPGGLSNVSDEEIGRLVVSKVGRYD